MGMPVSEQSIPTIKKRMLIVWIQFCCVGLLDVLFGGLRSEYQECMVDAEEYHHRSELFESVRTYDDNRE